MPQSVPVLMYHSIGNPDRNWIWHFLTCPWDVFEKQIQALSRRGFHTISLQELYDYMCTGKSLPPRPVVLTFDDGYLDNWIYAYPILKKYSFRGTIFVNPEFVDPTLEYRPNMDDIRNGRCSFEELQGSGFLSWREMREMEASGVIDIQSHALTHTWYFNSPAIIDFRHPGDGYIWLDWNKHPQTKHNYRSEKYLPEYGSPVYSYGPSLITRKYFPDPTLKKVLVEYVGDRGGRAFFEKDNWRNKLQKLVRDYGESHSLNDRFETEIEYIERVEHELYHSKEIIGEKLGKQISFLCWPNGASNEITLRIASQTGYLSSTYSSRAKGFRNKFGEDAARIKRISALHITGSDASKLRFIDSKLFVAYVYSYYYSSILPRALRYCLNIAYRLLHPAIGH